VEAKRNKPLGQRISLRPEFADFRCVMIANKSRVSSVFYECDVQNGSCRGNQIHCAHFGMELACTGSIDAYPMRTSSPLD